MYIKTEFTQHQKHFPCGTSGKELACQCRGHKRHKFYPWVGKIPWRRAQQPTLAFLPGELHGQRSLVGYSPLVAKSRGMSLACTQHALSTHSTKTSLK